MASKFVITPNEVEIFQNRNHCESVLKRLRDREDLCDVELIAGDSGKRISAHRLVLLASSDYFTALFRGPIEVEQKRQIIINEVDGDALEKIVNYCYTGSIELRRNTIESLITTANCLQLNEITERCCEFLIRCLDLSSCFDVLFFAHDLNLEVLSKNAKKFICENFEVVSESPKFLLLNAKQLKEFIAIDELEVSSEELVFKVLMKWIEYEPADRKKHFTELLAHVRLHLLPQNFLFGIVEPLCNTTESLKVFVNALKPKHLVTSKRARDLLAIYEEPSDVLQIARYNIDLEEWTKVKTLHHRPDFAVTLMDENLIIVGGVDEDYSVGPITKLNLQTMNSTRMAALNTRRRQHSLAVLKGLLYVVGGYYDQEYLKSVERWDPVSQKWQFVAPMQSARADAGVAVINDRLYVTGGCSDGVTLLSVECYNPDDNVWTSTAPMQTARSLHSLVANKGFLFAIGGHNGEVERYDPTIDTWTSISVSHLLYNSARCASLGSEIFIYNNSNFYKMNCETSKLQILSNPPVDSWSDCKAQVSSREVECDRWESSSNKNDKLTSILCTKLSTTIVKELCKMRLE